MKEIGGYFGLEQFVGCEYHEGLLAVNNGRNALAHLLKVRNIRKLYIPYFLCDSVEGVCQREGCPVAYYHIDQEFLPRFEGVLGSGEWLYVVNFYGQIDNDQVRELKQHYGNIIFDNVQAFFQRPVPNVDTVYSCRKFFGVPDGGYLATDAPALPLETDISKDRMKHILGRYEGCASDYHSDFKANDHSFVDLPVRAMSRLTHNILCSIDYEIVRQKRNENYAVLEQLLGPQNCLKLTMPDGPYAYPFYCENGMEVKRRLAAQKIYVATLWPNVLSMEDSLEKRYAENILPLPCDQRYSRDDMKHMVQTLMKCIADEVVAP